MTPGQSASTVIILHPIGDADNGKDNDDCAGGGGRIRGAMKAFLIVVV
eukprot:CAMPEP_0183328288 /NCGR_PEP_ID=MMETSP0160_2-20130417/84203_1 /TAXON_ID=2839 ORGANISM="Odontella Sinensis, Strain Grunow 1884" /NCGR_SAMPLE_ID=MMETSP0160_2 /ASSEMBLY_ACC=CAM_ASM_000250 /LENGTH=47 /DNA_ID= /DNA_START= /DNA_END= /DNA_ORIENTATION=